MPKIHQIYAAARERVSRPISLMAAEVICKVKPKDNVLLITNSYEMDGAPGIAALARAIDIGVGAAPIIATYTAGNETLPDPKRCARIVPETCIAAGLMPVEYSRLKDRKHRVAVIEFPPLGVDGAIRESRSIIQKYNPSLVISSEASGRNIKGVYHSAFGYGRWGDPNQPAQRLDHILDAAREARVPTISLGDNGNEMGFGSIEDIIRKYHPWGDKCICPCGSGIASSVKSDIVFPVAISNWGCYGIAACIAHLTRNAEAIHDGETQKRILIACANIGCPDGATDFATPTEDGTPYMTGVHVLELLRLSAIQSLKHFVRDW